jgi:uncharacterized membrane protein YeaQ/YmgE (transglycosylase-associated protein family)
VEDEMLELIWIIVIGIVIRAVAKFVMPGPDPGGQGAGFIASVIGAILVLFVYRRMRKRQA